MKLYLLIVLLICIVFVNGQTPSNDLHWEEVWEDQFNVDLSKWCIINGCDHKDPDLIMLSDNVVIRNGFLVIMAHSTPEECPPSIEGCSSCDICIEGKHKAQSGWVETKENFNFEYGYIEALIKCPYETGLLPGFWTWIGDGDNWPYQEIDIFEMQPGFHAYCYGSSYDHDNYMMTSTIHLNPPNGACNDPDADGSTSFILDYTQWHIYGLEWSPSRIIWYVDGYPIKIYKNSKITDSTPIIFSLLRVYNIPLPENFYDEMLVDWVKVYKLKESCDEFINSGYYNFSDYTYTLKNFIIIGGEGFSNSLLPNQDIILRASQFIDIYGDFFIPLGASFYADANKNCSNDLNLICSQTFNPCNTFIYDNLIKKIIEIGGNGCS